jgi:hypothetical protein
MLWVRFSMHIRTRQPHSEAARSQFAEYVSAAQRLAVDKPSSLCRYADTLVDWGQS